MQGSHLPGEFGLTELLYYFAVLHDQKSVGQGRCKPEVLFHHHDGVSALTKHRYHFSELLDNHRSEAFRDFIK